MFCELARKPSFANLKLSNDLDEMRASLQDLIRQADINASFGEWNIPILGDDTDCLLRISFKHNKLSWSCVHLCMIKVSRVVVMVVTRWFHPQSSTCAPLIFEKSNEGSFTHASNHLILQSQIVEHTRMFEPGLGHDGKYAYSKLSGKKSVIFHIFAKNGLPSKFISI